MRFLSPGPWGLTRPLVNQDYYDFFRGIGGTGSGPFATNAVPLVWFLWLVKADLKAIDQTRIPNASVNAPSFLDMVPPRNKTHGDTLSFIRIVSSGTHCAPVKKTSMEARLLVSPYLRMAIQLVASDQGSLAVWASQQQQYRRPIRLVLKYYQISLGRKPLLALTPFRAIALTLSAVHSYDGKLLSAGVAQW